MLKTSDGQEDSIHLDDEDFCGRVRFGFESFWGGAAVVRAGVAVVHPAFRTALPEGFSDFIRESISAMDGQRHHAQAGRSAWASDQPAVT